MDIAYLTGMGKKLRLGDIQKTCDFFSVIKKKKRKPGKRKGETTISFRHADLTLRATCGKISREKEYKKKRTREKVCE